METYLGAGIEIVQRMSECTIIGIWEQIYAKLQYVIRDGFACPDNYSDMTKGPPEADSNSQN